MFSRRVAGVIGILGLGLALATATTGWTQQDAAAPPPAASDQQLDPQDGEVLARGPVNEAFAEPVNANPKPTEVVPKEPPPAIEELPPDQKPAGENVQWFPGYWSWDETRTDFIWVSGIWRVPPPSRNWVPGHWDKIADGWQWTPGFWMALTDTAQQADQPNNVEYLPEPPAPVVAAASTPAPDDQSVYVPGVWVYRDTRYLWRPGFWVDYRPGWVWMPAHYVWTPAGYVFVEGYWDLELSRRGMLFAPVYFRRPLWREASWFYQPRYIVYNDFLSTALFVRPRAYSYYFGDYFEPSYRSRGYIAWVDFRVGRVGYDPLFSYYRWSHRDDRRAVSDLREVYAARYSGRAERPPVTLVQQNTLIQNIQNNSVTNVTNITHVTALAPLNNVNRNVVKLQPVARAQQLQEQKFAQNLRQAGATRSRQEAQLLTTRDPATTQNARPISARVNVPLPRVPNNRVAGVQPPPPPTHPAISQTIRPEANRPRGQGEITLPTTTRPPIEPRPQTPLPENRPPARTEPMPPQRPENRPPARTEPMPPQRPENRPPARTEPMPQPRPEPRPPARAEPPMPQTLPKAEPPPRTAPPPRVEPARPPVRPPAPPEQKRNDKKG